ncbi:MAG: LPS N-acetylglucosaminyltransferase [Thermodesulfobacteriota bacterium]|nr:MAG: LPS N-acetylglucosaminyltransferase [Thermodesulfobacteriota bacterium]
MKKIAFLISDLGCGGAQRVLINVLNNIDLNQFKVVVVTLYDETTDFFKLPGNVERVIIGFTKEEKNIFKSIYFNLKRIFKIRKTLITYKVDYAMSFIGVMNILLVLAAIKLKLKVIISERNDPNKQSIGFPWDAFRKKIYPYADVVTANSHGALDTLSQYVLKKKLLYLPNPFPVVNTNTLIQKNASDSVIRLLAVGRLYPQKNYKVLLKALYECVRSTKLKYRLTILGDGPLYDELNEYCVQLGIDEIVTWKKSVVDTETYYLDSDLYLLPSSHEGMPNSLLEAMAYGLAVIVSDASEGPLEVVENNVTGAVVKVDSSEALADKIQFLSANREIRLKLASNAKNYIDENNNSMVMNVWESLFK